MPNIILTPQGKSRNGKPQKECVKCFREGRFASDKCPGCSRRDGGAWCPMCEEGFIEANDICSFCSYDPKK